MFSQNPLLVTGGLGFIGSNFVRQRLAAGDRVVNLDKVTYAGNPRNLADIEDNGNYLFVRGGIEDKKCVEEIFQTHRPRAVVNFAAETHVDRSILGPDEFLRTNVLGTCSLLEISLGYWRSLSSDEREQFRFLQISTDEVYGSLSAQDPRFTEKTSHSPNSPYAASKASADHFVRAYFHTYGLPVLTTNCSNNYGPYQFPEKLIPLMVLNALNSLPLPVYGDGLNVRDWLYVEDHCEAVALVLSKGRPGETYNIGGESEKTNVEVVKTICAIMDELHRAVPCHENLIRYVTDRPGHDRRYAVDCEKIKRELGWRPRQDFVTGIRSTVEWYLLHRDWIDAVTSGAYRNWIEANYASRNSPRERN